MKTYIGIDNGVTGGLAVVKGSEVTHMLRMPVQKARTGKEVNILSLLEWVNDIPYHDFIFILEEPGGSKSASAAKSMAGSFHSIRSMLELCKFPYERVTPMKWQKVMLPGCKAGETKPRALARSKEIWPTVRFIPEGCRTPHDGIIDAALMAEWARRSSL